jgi:hypothetical protein
MGVGRHGLDQRNGGRQDEGWALQSRKTVAQSSYLEVVNTHRLGTSGGCGDGGGGSSEGHAHEEARGEAHGGDGHPPFAVCECVWGNGRSGACESGSSAATKAWIGGGRVFWGGWKDVVMRG